MRVSSPIAEVENTERNFGIQLVTNAICRHLEAADKDEHIRHVMYC